jgi:hypothetical protein
MRSAPFPASATAEGGQFNGPPSSAGTLVRVLEPPVKDGVNPVRMRSGFMSWSTGHGLVTMLALCIDDYAEIWVNGDLPRAAGRPSQYRVVP